MIPAPAARARTAGQASIAPRLRGIAVGSLVAALSVAAHGTAGGTVPSSSAIVLLLLASGTIGALAAEAVPTSRSPRGRLTLLGALVGGQLAGHVVFSLAAGHHASHAAGAGGASHLMGMVSEGPAVGMLIAHTVAALVCAVLIECAESVYGPVTSAIRRLVPTRAPVLTVTVRAAVRRTQRPLPVIEPLSTTPLSQRGPPVPA
ncbi:MAG: hypothetical protein L0H59_10395 [Tomitella sp.]|nr:hypothetical protein [Tomitella sp.]